MTPIAAHASMTVAALEAGKHAACTVPMATTVEDCLQDRRGAEEERARST